MTPKQWFETSGLTFKDLEEKTAFSAGYLCDVINRKKRGSVDVFRSLEQLSGGAVTFDDFFTEGNA